MIYLQYRNQRLKMYNGYKGLLPQTMPSRHAIFSNSLKTHP